MNDTEVWLTEALDRVAPCVRPRLAAEYRLHMQDMQDAGLSRAEIVAELGDPKAVNRALLRQYLTGYEQKVLESRHWSVWRSWLPLLCTAGGVLVMLLLRVSLIHTGSAPLLLLFIAALLTMLGYGWQETRHLTPFERTVRFSLPGIRLAALLLFVLGLHFLLELEWKQLVNMAPTAGGLLFYRHFKGLTLMEKAHHSGWKPVKLA